MVSPRYPDEKLDLVYNSLFRNLMEVRIATFDDLFKFKTSVFNQMFDIEKHELGVSGPNMIPLGLILAIIMLTVTHVIMKLINVMKVIMDDEEFPRPSGLLFNKKKDRFYEQKANQVRDVSLTEVLKRPECPACPYTDGMSPRGLYLREVDNELKEMSYDFERRGFSYNSYAAFQQECWEQGQMDEATHLHLRKSLPLFKDMPPLVDEEPYIQAFKELYEKTFKKINLTPRRGAVVPINQIAPSTSTPRGDLTWDGYTQDLTVLNLTPEGRVEENERLKRHLANIEEEEGRSQNTTVDKSDLWTSA